MSHCVERVAGLGVVGVGVWVLVIAPERFGRRWTQIHADNEKALNTVERSFAGGVDLGWVELGWVDGQFF
ncbi:MAG: hypothetical protein ABI972_23725 [Acidobacteriota bacterium]